MDLWALGVILCALLTGHVPFVSLLAQELTIRNICYLDVNFSAQCWEDVPLPAIDLITGMLQKDPYKRITIEQVLKHPWLHSSDASQNIGDL
jgi:calcium-dependent protein kinase